MTYSEFVLQFIDPTTVSDEAAKEGTYYTRAIFDQLHHPFRVALGLVLSTSRSIVRTDIPNLIWIKAVLSALSVCVVEQGRNLKYPRPGDTIPRSKEPWIVDARIEHISYPSINHYKPSEN